MPKQVDTSRGLTGCGPFIVFLACIFIVLAVLVVVTHGGSR